MFVEGLYIVVCYCVLLAHSFTVNKRQCVGSVCYYLYEAKTSYATWTSSKDMCKNNSLKMLWIESSETQAAVEQFLQDLPENTQRQVWIGGQRSADATLRYMNGTEFHEQVSNSNNEKDLYCLYVKLCTGKSPEYFADNCDEKTSTSRIVCQYEVNKMGQCAKSDSLFDGRCYRKTKYGGDANKIDWYSGQTYCSQSDIQGDIAYSYLDNNTWINSIKSLVAGSRECIQMWLGVRSRIWFWQSDADDEAHRSPIRYFNWYTNAEIKTDGNCIYIDRNSGNKWAKASCNTESLKYFICMNESDTAPTSSTILRSITNVTTTSEGLDSVMDNTHATQPGSSFQPAYSAAIVISVVVLALAIGLTVFFVFKKRRCRAKEHNYINDGLHNPSGKQQKDDDPEYDDVKMNDDDGDDVINPYGLTGGVSTRKNEVRHLETPSGDLYALSSKQVNKPDKNKNTGDVNKNVEDVEELYAKPKKQRDLKPKASKDGKVNRNGTNLVGHLTSSDGSVSKIGQKHTEHFESPSGEVYATVTTE